MSDLNFDWCKTCGDRAVIVDEEKELVFCDPCGVDFLERVWAGRHPYYTMSDEARERANRLTRKEQ